MIKNHKLDVKQIPSPNQSGTIKPTMIVLHYTATGPSKNYSVANYFTRPAAKVSAHLVVERDGTTAQCVDFDKKAWHAGRSVWKGRANCNDFSIGIEIDNWGYLTKNQAGQYISHTGKVVDPKMVLEAKNKRGNPGYWEIYDPRQLQKVSEIIDELLESYPSITEIVGHEDIAPGRKIDPGPALYDFQRKMANKFNGGRTNFEKTDIREVTSSGLRVRTGAGTNYSILTTLPKGAQVEVIYDSGLWSKIKHPDGEAWVYDKYLK